MSNEVQARQKYIFDSLHLWTSIQESNENCIILTSIPSTSLDILFIVGHNYYVYDYLNKNALEIPEKNIVAITCDGNMHFSSLNLHGKTLYICHQNSHKYADLLDGVAYNLNFNVTESELLLYNSKSRKDILERLDCCFTKLNCKGGEKN